MPTIFKIKNFRFFFFSNEGSEPFHIHVESDEKYAKFWLKPIELSSNWGFKSHELNEIKEILFQNQQLIEERWYEFFKS